jgi:hypothetical protein
MDCKTARLLLDFDRALPAPELEAGEAERLHEHLAECPVCRSAAQIERQVDEHLGRAVRAVPVPDGLRQRLLTRLESERQVWYRRRVWVPAAAAAAAVLLLAVWLGLGPGHPLPRPDVDYHALNQQLGSPPERVQEWFAETYHVQTTVPPQLDYNFLAFYDLASFQGQRVPLLYFIRGEFTARVYVLSDRQFDLSDLKPEKMPGYPVVVLEDPRHPHVRYVVIYTSEQLDWFLDKHQRQAA